MIHFTPCPYDRYFLTHYYEEYLPPNQNYHYLIQTVHASCPLVKIRPDLVLLRPAVWRKAVVKTDEGEGERFTSSLKAVSLNFNGEGER
jgi:hypothetical protein